MRWLRELYVGEAIGKKANKIKWKINHNAGTIDVYVISIASNKDNLLDIIPAYQLMQKGYPKKEMIIVGLAKGYDEAVELTQKILLDVYNSTECFDVRAFFGNMEVKGR